MPQTKSTEGKKDMPISPQIKWKRLYMITQWKSKPLPPAGVLPYTGISQNACAQNKKDKKSIKKEIIQQQQ